MRNEDSDTEEQGERNQEKEARLEKQTLILKDACTPMFIAALLTITKVWKQSKCSWTGEWIKMCVCVCVCVCVMEHYSAIKKNEIMSFAATWINIQGSMLSEIKVREKQTCTLSFICGIEKIKQTNIII